MARRGTPALYELLGRTRDAKNPSMIPTKIPPNTAIGVPPRTGTAPRGVGPSSSAPKSSSLKSSAFKASAFKMRLQPATMRTIRLVAAGVIAVGVIVLAAMYLPAYLPAFSRSNSESDSVAGTESDTASIERAVAVNPIPQTNLAPNKPADSNATRANSSKPTAAAPAIASENSARNPAKNPAAPAQNPAVAIDPELGLPLAPAQRGLDPRQAGLQYCVIASVLESNAERLVQFCRERGLDAWVVPDHNGRLREITVLPGIPKSESKGAAAKALEVRIRKVGAMWKAAAKGNSDFEDRYFKLYNG